MIIVFKLTELLCSCSTRIIHFNYPNKTADRESLDLYVKSVLKEILFIEISKMKLNSEHLFEIATLAINEIWRMQYFSDTAHI